MKNHTKTLTQDTYWRWSMKFKYKTIYMIVSIFQQIEVEYCEWTYVLECGEGKHLCTLYTLYTTHCTLTVHTLILHVCPGWLLLLPFSFCFFFFKQESVWCIQSVNTNKSTVYYLIDIQVWESSYLFEYQISIGMDSLDIWNKQTRPITHSQCICHRLCGGTRSFQNGVFDFKHFAKIVCIFNDFDIYFCICVFLFCVYIKYILCSEFG